MFKRLESLGININLDSILTKSRLIKETILSGWSMDIKIVEEKVLFSIGSFYLKSSRVLIDTLKRSIIMDFDVFGLKFFFNKTI